MKNLILILSLLSMAGCATDASRLYDQRRAEANPNYLDESNKSTTPPTSFGISPEYARYLSCVFRYSGRFSAASSNYICS